MGQVTPCCELAASTTRSYIDGRAATPNSELFHDRSSEKYNSPLKQGIEAKDMDEDMHPPNFLEIEDDRDLSSVSIFAVESKRDF